MNRVLLLNMSEAEATKACGDLDVGISVLEKLDSGGVRLVCISMDGAAAMRHKLRTKLIDGPVTRSRVFSRGMQPYHSSVPQEVKARPFASERNSR